MDKVADYGKVQAKVKAMSKNLLTLDDFEYILSFKSFVDVVDFLKGKPTYLNAFSKTNVSELTHRGIIEHLIKLAFYEDFLKLYKMSGNSCRRFMKLYFKKYEISILKDFLNQVFAHKDISFDIDLMSKFLPKHSKLNLERLNVNSQEEFIKALEGSEYHNAVKHLINVENSTLFDYEIALELYYFKYLWSKKNELFTEADKRAIKNIWSGEFDVLNMIWIYRSKQYYNIPESNIKSLLIPHYRSLDDSKRTALIDCETIEEMNHILSDNYYFKKYNITDISMLEQNYSTIIKGIFRHNQLQLPYSIAFLYHYLYRKEQEVERLIVSLECIRYGLSVEEGMKRVKNK